MEKASALLARRAHARSELEIKLRRYAPEPAWVEQVLGHLEELGLLDDRRFASSAADSMVRAGRYGPRRIANRLHQHGVSPDLVTEAMTGLDADWDEDCLRLIEKMTRTRGAATLDDPKGRAKMIRFLAGRGFSGQVIQKAILRARSGSRPSGSRPSGSRPSGSRPSGAADEADEDPADD